MNVLSLFDGMSCARIALKELGIKVDKYFASEIDNEITRVEAILAEEERKNQPSLFGDGFYTT